MHINGINGRRKWETSDLAAAPHLLCISPDVNHMINTSRLSLLYCSLSSVLILRSNHKGIKNSFRSSQSNPDRIVCDMECV